MTPKARTSGVSPDSSLGVGIVEYNFLLQIWTLVYNSVGGISYHIHHCYNSASICYNPEYIYYRQPGIADHNTVHGHMPEYCCDHCIIWRKTHAQATWVECFTKRITRTLTPDATLFFSSENLDKLFRTVGDKFFEPCFGFQRICSPFLQIGEHF